MFTKFKCVDCGRWFPFLSKRCRNWCSKNALESGNALEPEIIQKPVEPRFELLDTSTGGRQIMTLEQIKALNQKENLKRHRVREINGQSKEWSKVNAVTGDTKYKESVPDRTKQWPKQPGLKDNGASKTESINSTLTDQEKGCGGCLVIIVVIVVISQIHQSQKQANDEEALREWKERQKMREEQEQSAELSNSLLLIKGAGEEWLQDATLHNVTVSKWRSASERDKLATCGQWIMTWATHRRATNQYDSMEDLKRHAEYLAQEVDTTIARWKGSDEISLAAVLAGMKLNLVK